MYRHCNPGGKNFYWNQDMLFVGFPGSGLMVLQEHMFRILGKALGAASARVVHSTVYGLFDAKGNINLKTIFGQVGT